MIFNPPELWYRSPPKVEIKSLPFSDYSVGTLIGNGVFIVRQYDSYGSSTSRIAVSHDEGETWTYVTIKENYRGGLTFQNGFFFALLKKNSNISDNWEYEPISVIARSTDGIHWEESAIPVVGRYVLPIYGNGIYVCLPGGQYKTSTATSAPLLYSNYFLYSYDGLEWKSGGQFPIAHNDTKSRSLYTVFTGTAFVAMNYNSPGEVVRSTDGLNWEYCQIPNAEGRAWLLICGNVLVAENRTTGEFYKSQDDGQTWTLTGSFPILDDSSSQKYGGTFWDGTQLITVRYGNVEGGGNVYSSKDYGATWRLAASPFDGNISYHIRGVFHDGRWVIAADNLDLSGNDSFLVYSDDFENWHSALPSNSLHFYDFAEGNGKMLIADFTKPSKACIVTLN